MELAALIVLEEDLAFETRALDEIDQFAVIAHQLVVQCVELLHKLCDSILAQTDASHRTGEFPAQFGVAPFGDGRELLPLLEGSEPLCVKLGQSLPSSRNPLKTLKNPRQELLLER